MKRVFLVRHGENHANLIDSQYEKMQGELIRYADTSHLSFKTAELVTDVHKKGELD